MGRALPEAGHEVVDAGLDLKGGSGGPLAVLLGGGLGKQLAHNVVLRRGTNVDEIIVERVLVAVQHALAAVLDRSGVVLDGKGHGLRAVLKVLVLGKLGAQLLVEHLVRARGEVAHVVQQREDADWLLALNQLAHDLVVKELDRRPLDALAHVLFLLLPQRQLNENLLQLLVDKVWRTY
jgi:hypothetical protein